MKWEHILSSWVEMGASILKHNSKQPGHNGLTKNTYSTDLITENSKTLFQMQVILSLSAPNSCLRLKPLADTAAKSLVRPLTRSSSLQSRNLPERSFCKMWLNSFYRVDASRIKSLPLILLRLVKALNNINYYLK